MIVQGPIWESYIQSYQLKRNLIFQSSYNNVQDYCTFPILFKQFNPFYMYSPTAKYGCNMEEVEDVFSLHV